MSWYKSPLNKVTKPLIGELIFGCPSKGNFGCPELIEALKAGKLEEALNLVRQENQEKKLFFDNRKATSVFIQLLYESGVNLFDYMKSVPPYAFWNASLSQDFILPDDITDLELCAFANSDLDHLPLSKDSKVEAIYQDVFAGTNIHGDIELPDSLEYLEASAFYNTEVISVLAPIGCQVEDYDNYAYEILRKN